MCSSRICYKQLHCSSWANIYFLKVEGRLCLGQGRFEDSVHRRGLLQKHRILASSLTLNPAPAPAPAPALRWPGLAYPSRLSNLQMDKGWAFQPFTTCKWTRAGGPPTPHDLGRQGTPTLHDLQMDKGWAPKPLTTWGGRAPNPSGLEAAEPSTLYDLGWGATNPSPKIGKPVTGPFGPELSPNAKPKFSSWCDIWVRLGRIWFLEDLGCRVYDFGFRILGSGRSRVPVGFRVYDFGFRILGSGRSRWPLGFCNRYVSS